MVGLLVTFSVVVIKKISSDKLKEERAYFGSQFEGKVHHFREIMAGDKE